MDLEAVTDRANGHAGAMVEGDLNRAGSDLAEGGRADAPAVMKAMPRSLDSAEVGDVAADGDDAVATITYRGGGREVAVESRWSEVDGRPMIVSLKLI
jgi:hypothetical protein